MASSAHSYTRSNEEAHDPWTRFADEPAAGAAGTPWRSGFADPPSYFKPSQNQRDNKMKVNFQVTPKLTWRAWNTRVTQLCQGATPSERALYNDSFENDGTRGKPYGLLVQISKSLSYHLRHNAKNFDSYDRRTGTVDVQEFLTKSQINWIWAAPDLFYVAVKQNPKSRFTLQCVPLTDGTSVLRISAAQGHSADNAPAKEETCKPITSETLHPTARWLIHGTSRKNAMSIVQDRWMYAGGVMPEYRRGDTRKDVHWSWNFPRVPGEQLTGLRQNAEVYVFLNINQYLASGKNVWEASNNVLLTDDVPLNHLWCLLDINTMDDVRTSVRNHYDVPDFIKVHAHTFRVNTYTPGSKGFKESKHWIQNWQEVQEQRLIVPSAESLPPINEKRLNYEDGEAEPETDSEEIEQVLKELSEPDGPGELDDIQDIIDLDPTPEMPDWNGDEEVHPPDAQQVVANPELGVSGNTTSTEVLAGEPISNEATVTVQISSLTTQERLSLLAHKHRQLEAEYQNIDFEHIWQNISREVEEEFQDLQTTTEQEDMTFNERYNKATTMAIQFATVFQERLHADAEHRQNDVQQKEAELLYRNIMKEAYIALREGKDLWENKDVGTSDPIVVNPWGEIIGDKPVNPKDVSEVKVPASILERANQKKSLEPTDRLNIPPIERDIEKLRKWYLELVARLPTKGNIYRMADEQDVVNKDQHQFNLLLANFGNVQRTGYIGDQAVSNKPSERKYLDVGQYQGGEFNLLYRVWADNMAQVILTCEANTLLPMERQSQYYGLRGEFVQEIHGTAAHVRAGTRGKVKVLQTFTDPADATGSSWNMYAAIFEISFGEHSNPSERGRPVTRAGMSKLICAVYHINNVYCNTMNNVRKTFQRFLQQCFSCQVDIVAGDANKAGLRYYNNQKTQDPWNSTVCIMIRRMVEEANSQRPVHRLIGVQEFNNSRPEDLAVLDNLDCMWCHIFSWGKTPMQQAVRSAIEKEGRENVMRSKEKSIARAAELFPHEWKISVKEAAIELDAQSLGIGPRDADSHCPLLLFISEVAVVNRRDRSSHAAYYRALIEKIKNDPANANIGWKAARAAAREQMQKDEEAGWKNPSLNIQHKRKSSASVRPERLQPRSPSYPPPRRSPSTSARSERPRSPIQTPPPKPTEGSDSSESSFTRRVIRESRQAQARTPSPTPPTGPPERQTGGSSGSGNWNRGWWDSSSWNRAGWTTAATWSTSTWGARGDSSTTDRRYEDSGDIFMTIAFTCFVILLLNVAGSYLVSTIRSYRSYRVNGDKKANKHDVSTQCNIIPYNETAYYTTARGTCAHLYRDCSYLEMSPHTVVQTRYICLQCISRQNSSH